MKNPMMLFKAFLNLIKAILIYTKELDMLKLGELS